MAFSILNSSKSCRLVTFKVPMKNFSYRSTGTVKKMILIEEQSGMLNKASENDK